MKRYDELLKMIDELPKYGNDICEIDEFARDVAYTYTKPLEQYRNPRGGRFQAGLYPVSANVPLGAQTGATPDGRLANTPIADGVGRWQEEMCMARQPQQTLSLTWIISLPPTERCLTRNSTLQPSVEWKVFRNS